MLLIALVLNIIVLTPVIAGLLASSHGMAEAFGADTDARRILTCVYGAILVISAALIGLHVTGHPEARSMTYALFGVQITYKLFTVALVGLASPVVMTNLFVVAVQVIAITATLLSD